MKKLFTILLIQLLLVYSGTRAMEASEGGQVSELVSSISSVSEVMLHDVASPPAAARFYAYAMLGAYYAISADKEGVPDIVKSFKVDPGLRSPETFEGWSKSFCASYALLEIGKHIMPSGYMLEGRQKELVSGYKKKHRMSSENLERNKEFSLKIADGVLNFAKVDGYNMLSTFTRYSPLTEEGRWYPTPPAYMEAIEPNWNTIRTFFLDSCNQFTPSSPVPYNAEKGSDFFVLLEEVYKVTVNLSSEQRDIAAFWDCNPFAVMYSGHLAIGLKKISPGGHWMSITGIACKKSNASFEKAVLAHTLVALTLHDAFISCWDEKYRSHRIRPETAINKLIDKEWKPLLQTPPFPEYTSGHSVISTASAEVLTHLFGDSFSFIDTSEEFFGLAPRTFSSFRSAANEAAVSRLYGGIHYRDAIEVGQVQGLQISRYIIQKLNVGYQ